MKITPILCLAILLASCGENPNYKPAQATQERVTTWLRDDTDAPNGPSGLRLYTDHGTGCQYLSSDTGGLTPRLDENRIPICKGKSNG